MGGLRDPRTKESACSSLVPANHALAFCRCAISGSPRVCVCHVHPACVAPCCFRGRLVFFLVAALRGSCARSGAKVIGDGWGSILLLNNAPYWLWELRTEYGYFLNGPPAVSETRRKSRGKGRTNSGGAGFAVKPLTRRKEIRLQETSSDLIIKELNMTAGSGERRVVRDGCHGFFQRIRGRDAATRLRLCLVAYSWLCSAGAWEEDRHHIISGRAPNPCLRRAGRCQKSKRY